MIEKFKTLFVVKSSLISLYLALTVPIPFITIDELKNISIIIFILGLYLITKFTSDYIETCDEKISYKTNLISKSFGRKNWEILWEEIKSIKSFPTSQGSKVFYFIDKKGRSILVPQRIESFDVFLEKISQKTNINTKEISIISPLWTYKLLTLLSVLMIVGEISLFFSRYYQY